MPLPHFLVLIISVIVAAGLTLWVVFTAGLPFAVVAMLALLGAAVLKLMQRVE